MPARSSNFLKKKSQILASISTHDSNDYTDKSPKGSIDIEIIDLIAEINAFDSYVTTSSCAGRVAVFVEGHKTARPSDGDNEVPLEDQDRVRQDTTAAIVAAAGPGGKGSGNKWLYVSHSRVVMPTEQTFHDLFELTPQSTSEPATYPTDPDVRLVKLTFSPLILHVLCSSLQAAKPLLAAAINAGFRESGVQSLKALDDEAAGVMVAIRTAGVGFESVVGWVEEGGTGEEVYRSCVDEGLLSMYVQIVNGRFGWNEERRERLRVELEALKRREEEDVGRRSEWEDKEVRRRRKREEGLRIKRDMERQGLNDNDDNGDTLVDDDLFLDMT
ncbi:hypothetical protein H2198_003660 [Neophaeococcomyces mojaviensis]|uniref:Uncharacterized protein n=1 Tax=Neophaeococcomyces mojaviensis TaxID=3383035 RepID=A0ACC3AAS6_9EURO|nr:hypothetical protein H2198_003660 [Knufia sp. JES_112]